MWLYAYVAAFFFAKSYINSKHDPPNFSLCVELFFMKFVLFSIVLNLKIAQFIFFTFLIKIPPLPLHLKIASYTKLLLLISVFIINEKSKSHNFRSIYRNNSASIFNKSRCTTKRFHSIWFKSSRVPIQKSSSRIYRL